MQVKSIAEGEHSAILLTFIKLHVHVSYAIKIFVLSIFMQAKSIAEGEHSAILSTFISYIYHLPFVFSKIHFVEHSYIQISMFDLVTCSHYETHIFYSLK